MKPKVLVISILALFALSVAFAYTRASTEASVAAACCCSGDSCPMKKKDAAGTETASCCDNCSCCKGDSCPMKMNSADKPHAVAEQDMKNVVMVMSEDSCCCGCCKKDKEKKDTASL